MTFVNFSMHAPNPIAAGPQAGIDSAKAAPDGSFSFDDVLDIVNPLQHIPVVGTLYRALSGDTIKTGPKIAGDTLYGGITGFASSIADTVFEKITGKNVGDTVLAMVEEAFSPAPDAVPGPASPSAGRSALPAPVPVRPAEQDAIVIPGQDALVMALNRAGIGRDVALRAADAYRRTESVSGAAANAALPDNFRATLAE
ncbi:MAG: hypothetical protein WDM81_16640 [Rhizomicrobium sp.]